MTVLVVVASLVDAYAGAGHGPPSANVVPLSFDATALAQLNGSAPSHVDVVSVCGSSTETFLTELFHTSPGNVTVQEEWGDIVPGKQVAVEGPIRTTHLGPTDLPFSHIYGDDLSMDVGLPPSLQPFSFALGPSEEPVDQIHVEIASGLIPHEVRSSQGSPDQTWRQASDVDLSGFLGGFTEPAIGDPALVMGRWIIDCGHGDYHAELHPMSFLAWSHFTGATNVVHAYMNPYRDTQRYSPDLSITGHVSDTTRFSDPTVNTFVHDLLNEILSVISGETDRLHSQELLEAVNVAPPPWTVCARAGSHGRLVVGTDIVTRPGVNVDMAVDHASGCATVTVTLTSQYKPLDQPIRDCQLPWAYLNEIASESVGQTVDVRSLLTSLLSPDLAALVVAHDPVVTCADPLAGPGVDETPSGQHVRVDPSQPYPFYGVVSVTRAAGGR